LNRSAGYTVIIILVFVILGLVGWILFGPQGRLTSQKSQVQNTVSNLETRNERLQSRLEDARKQLEELRKENQQIADRFRNKIEEAPVRRQNQQVILQLKENILFELGSATIKDRGRNILQKVATVLKDYPEREIRVLGHADTLPIDTLKYPSNWELSSQRAINVLKYLVYGQEISKTRIGATAFGQFRPLVSNTSPENRRKNRRVEILLYPKQFNQKTLDALEGDTM